MKQKEKKDLKQKSKEELIQQVAKTAEELVKLKMEKQVGRLKNTQLINKKRYDLAVIKTILKEKEINQ